MRQKEYRNSKHQAYPEPLQKISSMAAGMFIVRSGAIVVPTMRTHGITMRLNADRSLNAMLVMMMMLSFHEIIVLKCKPHTYAIKPLTLRSQYSPEEVRIWCPP